MHQLDFRELIARLVASGKLNPAGAIEVLSKLISNGSIDPGLLFSKFAASYALFLLTPSGVRSRGHTPSPATERAYDLLWLAYEQWLTRGVTHLAEAAGLWTSFYGNIRWSLVHHRDDEEFERNLDRFIARSGHVWLSEVRQLTQKNFNLLVEEMNGVIDELRRIETSTAGHEMATEIFDKETKDD
jgi:hypothetical protein